MTDQAQCKKTYLWHWKPETNELVQYPTMNDFRRAEPEFKPGDGTRIFKGRELEFRTVEKVVLV